jgi:anthranilate phosphoribosyltransferase
MNHSVNWQSLLDKLSANQDLSKTEATWAMESMISGESDPEVVGEFLLVLRAKGESSDEISGFVDVMLQNAIPVPVSNDAVDIVGTGGDQLGTVNISSMAAIVVAAAGVPVLKHGSRSASGKTGSSEFLEALGVKLELSPDQIAEVFEKIGISFFFAPLFHPALRHVAPIRKKLGVPTTFNFLGPMVNPVQPLATALGVANAQILDKLADQIALRRRSAIVFRGEDGLDELTITGNSYVKLVKNGKIADFTFDPATLGIQKADIKDLIGGDASENANIARELLTGNLGENHPIFQIVALNAAVAMAAYDLSKANDLDDFDFAQRINQGFQNASLAISSGKANELLRRWVEESNR